MQDDSSAYNSNLLFFGPEGLSSLLTEIEKHSSGDEFILLALDRGKVWGRVMWSELTLSKQSCADFAGTCN